MRKRVFIATLAAAAPLVAPVAGVDAKPDGGGKSKKCDKPKQVGFKLNGTFGGFDGTGLSGELTSRSSTPTGTLATGWVARPPRRSTSPPTPRA